MTLTAEEVFAFTQSKRKALVDYYMSGEKPGEGDAPPPNVPVKTSEQRIVLEALAGMDHAEIEKLKITVDNKANDQADAVLGFLSQITERIGNQNIFENMRTVGEIPNVSDPLLAEIDFVPGVLDTEQSDLEFNSFIEQQKAG